MTHDVDQMQLGPGGSVFIFERIARLMADIGDLLTLGGDGQLVDLTQADDLFEAEGGGGQRCTDGQQQGEQKHAHDNTFDQPGNPDHSI